MNLENEIQHFIQVEQQASINTGFDEILEINKVVNNNGTVGNVSRVLIDFDYSYISQSIVDGENSYYC